MGVGGLRTRVRALEAKRAKGNAVLDWLDNAEAELPVEVLRGRLDADLKVVYDCVRKWFTEGALR
jgi:hypothetical protein